MQRSMSLVHWNHWTSGWESFVHSICNLTRPESSKMGGQSNDSAVARCLSDMMNIVYTPILVRIYLLSQREEN